MARRVVLAYSGGLDTSVAVRWLIDELGYEVVCLCADVGQEGNDWGPVLERAKAAGARVFAIGFGAEGDVLRPLLEQVASTPTDVRIAPNAFALELIYRMLVRELLVCP